MRLAPKEERHDGLSRKSCASKYSAVECSLCLFRLRTGMAQWVVQIEGDFTYRVLFLDAIITGYEPESIPCGDSAFQRNLLTPMADGITASGRYSMLVFGILSDSHADLVTSHVWAGHATVWAGPATLEICSCQRSIK